MVESPWVMTSHHIPMLVADAFPKAMTPTNTCSVFRSTGTLLFDRNIFPKVKFLSNYSTNRDLLSISSQEMFRVSSETLPSTSTTVTTEGLQPFPKRSPRKSDSKNAKRRKTKSEILTSTPIKHALEEAARNKDHILIPKKKLSYPKEPKMCHRSSTWDVPDTDGDCSFNSQQLYDDSSEVSDDETLRAVNQSALNELSSDDHVLVKVPGKKTVRYFAGRILSIFYENEIDTKYMRRQGKTYRAENSLFYFSDIDVVSHNLQDIIMKLPLPTVGQTKRSSSLFDFHSPALNSLKIE